MSWVGASRRLELMHSPLEILCSLFALSNVVGVNARSVGDLTAWLELVAGPLET